MQLIGNYQIILQLNIQKKLNLYWFNNTVYDELSANHNGIIGEGKLLKETIQSNNR